MSFSAFAFKLQCRPLNVLALTYILGSPLEEQSPHYLIGAGSAKVGLGDAAPRTHRFLTRTSQFSTSIAHHAATIELQGPVLVPSGGSQL